MSGTWDRDLLADLDSIRAWDPDLVLTLLDENEFAILGVPDFQRQVMALGVPWAFTPIRDGSVPNADFAEMWKSVGPRLRNILRRGGRVLIHCKAGLGRTGMIAASIMAELGMNPEAAIKAVRRSRGPHAVERAQEKYVLASQALPKLCSRSYGIRGSLFGAAVGDALGTPFEQLTASQIELRLSEPFVWKYHRPVVASLLASRKRGAGWPTDDTAMALSVATVVFEGGDLSQRKFSEAFEVDLDLLNGRFGKLFWDGLPTTDFDGTTIRGCSSASRAYPIGVLTDRCRVLIVAETQARITHSHPAAIAAAKAVAVIVHDALRGFEPTLDAPDGIDDLFFLKAWHDAHHSIERGMDRLPPHLLSVINNSWSSVARACAIAYIYQDEPTRALAAAAASGGDTATVASIVGAIVGARRGIEEIDQPLLDKLKVRDDVQRTINLLAIPEISCRVEEKAPRLSRIERQIYRVYSMLEELHRRGYEQLRIIPGMNSSGCHYRSSITYARNVYADHGALSVDFDLLAHNTTGNDANLFEWRDAPGANISKLADYFVERFRDIAERGFGADKEYVYWFKGTVCYARQGAFPIAYSDSIYYGPGGMPAPRLLQSTKANVRLPIPPPGFHPKHLFKQNIPADEYGIPYDTIEEAIRHSKRLFNAAEGAEERERLRRLSAVYEWAASQGLRISNALIAEAQYMTAYDLENLYFSFPDSETYQDRQRRRKVWDRPTPA